MVFKAGDEIENVTTGTKALVVDAQDTNESPWPKDNEPEATHESLDVTRDGWHRCARKWHPPKVRARRVRLANVMGWKK